MINHGFSKFSPIFPDKPKQSCSSQMYSFKNAHCFGRHEHSMSLTIYDSFLMFFNMFFLFHSVPLDSPCFFCQSEWLKIRTSCEVGIIIASVVILATHLGRRFRPKSGTFPGPYFCLEGIHTHIYIHTHNVYVCIHTYIYLYTCIHCLATDLLTTYHFIYLLVYFK